MNVWAVANQKGGVGKTTSAISLGGLLASQGQRVLLIDIDPHGSLTSYLKFDPETADDNVYSLFSDDHCQISSIIQSTDIPRIDLVCSTTLLATLDRKMGVHNGKGLVLKNALKSIEDEYDYVIFDCPPMLGVLMVNALAACDYLVIPVQSEYLALKGLERMVRTVTMINRSRQSRLDYIIIPTIYDRRTKVSAATLSIMHKEYARELWHSVIPVDTKFREASLAGYPISMLSPKSRGSIAYDNLLQYIMSSRQPVLEKRVSCA